jgi:hypothetical protein
MSVIKVSFSESYQLDIKWKPTQESKLILGDPTMTIKSLDFSNAYGQNDRP